MSDGASGNAFGDALESMATNTKKAIGGTLADFTKSATNQVKGNSSVSGSFTPGASQQSQNPAPEAGKQALQGGDLFSPDMMPKPQISNSKSQGSIPQPLTVAGQQLAQNPDAKSPEEAKHIQEIEAELRSMHQAYYQDFAAKAEGRDRKTQIEVQEKAQDDRAQQMEDLQKKEEKKQEDRSVFQAKRAAEIKGGMG
ncbi:MAG TPA: hypothetical protein VLB73_00305 [Patescibacteria group bacterium]|nr:hypothetical protein [Patescibacteria group bacterium]